MDKLTIGLILGIIGGISYESNYQRHLSEEMHDHFRNGSYYLRLDAPPPAPYALPAGERRTTG